MDSDGQIYQYTCCSKRSVSISAFSKLRSQDTSCLLQILQAFWPNRNFQLFLNNLVMFATPLCKAPKSMQTGNNLRIKHCHNGFWVSKMSFRTSKQMILTWAQNTATRCTEFYFVSWKLSWSLKSHQVMSNYPAKVKASPELPYHLNLGQIVMVFRPDYQGHSY